MAVTREEVIAELKRRGHNGPIPGEQAQQPNQSQLIQSLQQLTPKKNMGHRVADAISVFAGGNPVPIDEQNDYSKLYAQEAIKSQFQNPLDTELKQERLKSLKAGITTDEEGNVVRTTDVARDKKAEQQKAFESRRQASQLRGELNQNTYVKRFQEMNSAATGIDAILSDTISRTDNKSKNVGDQAIITLYNKILDPLSVVRESEYARTPEGQSLMNRLQGFAQKVQAGGSGLTDQDRIEVARAAKVLINNSGELYNQKLSDYEGLANSFEADPSLVTGGFQKFSPYDVDKQYQIGGQAQGVGQTKSGNKFRKVNQ